jgi:basic membrane protein A
MVLNSPSGGRGYDQAPEAGLVRATKVLGIEGVALSPPVREGYLPSLVTLAREGYNLIFAVGFEGARDIMRAARMFPHTRFGIIDVSVQQLGKHPPKNVIGLVFREQEVGYVVGYLAALMEDRRARPHIVSTVGGFSFVPSVQRYIAGFQAGATKADPHIRLLNDYSNNFANTNVCREVARAQIAKGSGVVFQVAGGCGLGALEAARAEHVFGIGVDTDQSYLGRSVLTSALKRWDRAVFRTVERLRNGTLPETGNIVFGYRGGDLGLGRISPEVPPSIARRVKAIERAVAAGRIRHIPVVPTVG